MNRGRFSEKKTSMGVDYFRSPPLCRCPSYMYVYSTQPIPHISGDSKVPLLPLCSLPFFTRGPCPLPTSHLILMSLPTAYPPLPSACPSHKFLSLQPSSFHLKVAHLHSLPLICPSLHLPLLLLSPLSALLPSPPVRCALHPHACCGRLLPRRPGAAVQPPPGCEPASGELHNTFMKG